MSVGRLPDISDPRVRDALERIARLQNLADGLEASGVEVGVARRVIEVSWESVLVFSESANVMAQALERLRELGDLPPGLGRRK